MKPADIFARAFPEFFRMKEPVTEPWKATTDIIRRLATPCPACHTKGLAGHQYALFASQIALPNSIELNEFVRLFLERRWRDLNMIQEFDGNLNALSIYALFCHSGGCMLAVRDPEELWDSASVLHEIPFDEGEAENIRTLAIELHEL